MVTDPRIEPQGLPESFTLNGPSFLYIPLNASELLESGTSSPGAECVLECGYSGAYEYFHLGNDSTCTIQGNVM